MKYEEKKRSLFFGLPLSFTKYTITEELITINSGLLRRAENDCYLYKIIDVRLESSLSERLCGLGTVHCFSSDVTDPNLTLHHIRNAREIKNFILKESEEARIRRKTLNTQSLDGGAAGEICGCGNDLDLD